MSNTVPSPAEAARLRALYATNPIVTNLVTAMQPFVGDVDGQVHDATGTPLTRAEAAAGLLALWSHVEQLTDRERRGVLAFFVLPTDRFPFDEASDRVLAKAAALDPTDRSQPAEYLREVAGSVMDHRLNYQVGYRDGQMTRLVDGMLGETPGAGRDGDR